MKLWEGNLLNAPTTKMINRFEADFYGSEVYQAYHVAIRFGKREALRR